MVDRLIDLLDAARHKYQEYEAEKDHRMRTAKTEAEFDAEANTYETRHSFYARELRNNGVEIPVRCKDCKYYIRMKERLTELLLRGKDKCLDTMCEECKYKDDENCGTSIIVDHLIANGVTVTIKKPPTDLTGKCGSCAYAKAECPSVYVRCTNPEHLAKYSRSIDRSLRQRTNPACRQYKQKE